MYLVGAGLALLGVLGLWMVLPNAEIPSLPDTFVMVVPPTDKRDGRGVDVPDELPPRRRCGMREGVASSLNLNKIRAKYYLFNGSTSFSRVFLFTSAIE